MLCVSVLQRIESRVMRLLVVDEDLRADGRYAAGPSITSFVVQATAILLTSRACILPPLNGHCHCTIQELQTATFWDLS